MHRAVVLIGLTALAACGRAPPKAAEAAPGPAPHNWAAVSGPPNGRAYTYYPRAHAEGGLNASTPTIVRYLGRGGDGVYRMSEVEDGVTMIASCLSPCADVRVSGEGLMQNGPLGGDSVTRDAMDDAVNGRLEVSAPPPAGK